MAQNRLELAKAKQAQEEKIRAAILMGLARKQGDDYEIPLDGAIWYYGAEYVERVMAWNRASSE